MTHRQSDQPISRRCHGEVKVTSTVRPTNDAHIRIYEIPRSYNIKKCAEREVFHN